MGSLADASLQGGALVVVAWAVCRALPGLSSGARCAIWWLASLKLLVGLGGSLVELQLLPAPEPAPLPVLPAIAASGGGDVVPAPPSFVPGLFALWALGAALLLAHTAWQWIQAARLRRRGRPVGEAIAAIAADVAEELGLRRVPEVREIAGPMVVGVFRPTVLIPPGLDEGELRLALAHELAHVRRRDLVWGWIPILAARVFFFHPLAHLALREYLLAREAACDAAVLALPATSPRDYGALLVRLGVRRSRPALAGMVSPVHHLRRRLVMMQNISKKRFGRLSALLVVSLGALVPVTVVAREAGSPRCMVVVDDDEGRRTIPCEDLGVTPPPRNAAKKTPLPPPPPLKRASAALPAPEIDIEACIGTYKAIMACTSSSPMVPDSARETMASSMDDAIRGLRLAYKLPQGRRALVDACKQLEESRQTVFETLGCD